MRRLLLLGLAAVVVAVAALTANLLVLGRAGGAPGPVGTLSPVQPALTVPASGPRHDDRRDERDHEDDDD